MTALIPFFFFNAESRTINGKPKAIVFPEPVSATPITSRLERRNGHAEDWMGEGFWKEEKMLENWGSLKLVD